MDKTYADTVRLLLDAAPDVFRSELFALKGGTAINLFVRDMPRLSVDIDIAFTPRQTPRDEALRAITAELEAVATRLTGLGMEVTPIADRNGDEYKVLVSRGDVQMKIEVNTVFRGTVLSVVRRLLVAKTATMFAVELELPTLAVEELYGGKLVAALDRQHPRDLFDVQQMYATDGLTDEAVECFVTYLAGHHRPIHEVLFAGLKNVEQAYTSSFEGMTTEPVSLKVLLELRARLFDELPKRLTGKQRKFLIGLARATPDWALLKCPHTAELPALRWKLQNLEKFKKQRPAHFEQQAEILEKRLS